MTNLINQLQFEVNCPGEEQAFYLRHSFQDTLQEQIIKAVDKVCADHVPEDEWIQIDRIVIDAGSFSSHSLYTDFGIVFQRKFEEELERKLSAIQSAKRKNSRQASWLKLFCYFLETGTMPWWTPETGIDFEAIGKEIFAAQPEALRQFFYARRFHQVIWTRAAYQLNAKAKSHIISFFEILVKAKELFETWVELVHEKNGALVHSSALNTESIIDGILLCNGPLIFRTTEIDRANTLQRIFTDHIEEMLSPRTTATASSIAEILHEVTREKIFRGHTETESPTLVTDAKELSVDDQTVKYTVKEAGIILLAPFLQQVFTKLGLYGKAGWENKEAAWRAAHLIKFIATGQQQQPEYKFVLEKIICGLPLEEPFPLEIFLTDEEMNESDFLLHSVLEHWKALRNTSLQGLRETFFRRDGLLTRKENDWMLQVERKTLDVLLDSLPWGYSAVRFPWNEYVIYTEW